MNTGIPVDLMHDCIVVGAELFRRGVTSLPKWAKTMIDTFGNRFKAEELKRIYQASKVYYRDVVSTQKIKKWNRKQKELDNNQQLLFEEDEPPAASDAVRKRKQAAQTLGKLADELQDVSGWMAYTYDVHRVFKEVFGKHYGKARTLLLAPFDRAKGAFIDDQRKWLNDLWRVIVKKYGIKAGSKESADLQRYGEGKMTPEALEAKYGKAKADKIKLADTWFRQAYGQLLDEVNKVRKEIYPNDPTKIIIPRENYYRHFQELAEGVSGLLNIFDTPANISSSMALQSEYTKPNSRWLPFARHRKTDRTKYDAVGGFMNYLKYWAHATHIDPHIPAFRALARELVAQTEDTKNEGSLNTFIKFLDNFANDLAGKTNPADRFWQELIGRRMFRAITWVNNRIKANVVLGNISASLSQIAGVPIGIARTGPINATRGFGRSVAGILFGNEPMIKSNFIKERYFDDYSKFDHGILKYPKRFAMWMMTVLDEVGTKYIWNCFYEQGLREGVSDPVAYADGLTRSVVAGRGIGEVPLVQKSKLVQLFAPFQLEAANYWHVVKDILHDRAFGQLISLAVLDWLFNRSMELIGRQPILYDPIQATIDAVKELFDDDDKDKWYQKVSRAVGREAGEVLANLPLGDAIMGLYPEHGYKAIGLPSRRQVFGKHAPRYGGGLPAGLIGALFRSDKWYDPVLKIVPPFGGNQIRKTVEGVTVWNRGRDKDAKGRTKWRVEQTPKTLLQSILFGKYGTDAAQKFLDKRM